MRTSGCFSNVNQIYCSARVTFVRDHKTPVTPGILAIKDKMRAGRNYGKHYSQPVIYFQAINSSPLFKFCKSYPPSLK